MPVSAVTLVERSDRLGGQVAQLHRTFPTLEPAAELLNPLVERVTSPIPRSDVMTGASVTEVGGYVGNFKVQVRQGERRNAPVSAGAIIVATGYRSLRCPPQARARLWAYPQVITTLEFERAGSR